MSAVVNSTVHIEPMRWWHIPVVTEMEAELFPRDHWSEEQFWEELAHPTRSYHVALNDSNSVVGYGGIYLMPPQSDLQTLAVSSTVQGQGVGAQLLSHLMDAASARGATEMILEVRSDNASAIRLYERAGFAMISRRMRYYPDGTDALIMRVRPLGGAK